MPDGKQIITAIYGRLDGLCLFCCLLIKRSDETFACIRIPFSFVQPQSYFVFIRFYSSVEYRRYRRPVLCMPSNSFLRWRLEVESYAMMGDRSTIVASTLACRPGGQQISHQGGVGKMSTWASRATQRNLFSLWKVPGNMIPLDVV